MTTAGKEKEHILLVDDDPRLRAVAEELLARLGYSVATAASGAEALAHCRQLDVTPVVILDLHLAGESGLEVMARLKEMDPQVRIVVASGFFSQEELSRLKALGAAGFLLKPFRREELERQIRAVQGERGNLGPGTG